ncbi:Protein N-acetyltransferase, RimJ/RimL family [Pseudobutyrivibrio sp. OR37]|uniref:GNAT family N-acetyltransferase n=1 Tax=Pseudobutyrivibrio sp. OR37 TaxID=1798186 RepID=UPI0008E5A6D8|nr:GNAT family N-acetyltransferase [Pseudobutyrivibrio sp. OR37]SFH68259.1 Protein N-acetyltransferase, RimJ/RimL family [Pseudobutyrivibrio sp. OR37]
MTEKNYLRNKIIINNVNELQPDYESGTLVLTESQAVVDECNLRGIPVAGIETEGGKSLSCQQLVMDVEELEDEDLERIYRRCAGIPWDIAYTKRCYIREYSEADLDDLFALYAQPHMTDYMEPLFEYQEEKEYERNYIEYIYKLYGFGMWLIFDRFTGKLIGRAGIEVRDTCDKENQAELGFAISTTRWRQGLAFEVCSKIVELAKEEYGLSSLIARCAPDNEASKGLLAKLGFEQVGFEADGDCRFFREI